MSKAIRILSNEIIEIMDIVNANALFQTYEYPNEIFYKLRKQINPFDLYYENENKDKEIERLNNIINELEKWLEEKQALYGINQQGFSWGVAGDCLDKLKTLKEGGKK